MNIAELTHQQTLTKNFPHYPTFILTTQHKRWYFFSSKEVTLRKKIMNTSLADFLFAQDANYTVYALKQIDFGRSNISGEATVQITKINKESIKIDKLQKQKGALKQDSIMLENQWKSLDYEKITLIRVKSGEQLEKLKIWTLFYSEHFLRCEANITDHLKESLTQYCLEIAKIFERKFLNEEEKIREFELVFQWNQNQGKIRVLYVQNVKLKQKIEASPEKKGRILFETNYKIGVDKYQKIEIAMQSFPNQMRSKNVQQEEDRFEEKRLRYIQFLKKLHSKANYGVLPGIDTKKNEEIVKQFACTACRNLVVLRQHDKERMVTQNRIPQIQLKRQVKMKQNMLKKNYDLVPICEKCYDSFVLYFKTKQNDLKKEELQLKKSRRSTNSHISSKENQNMQDFLEDNQQIPYKLPINLKLMEKDQDKTEETSQYISLCSNKRINAHKNSRANSQVRKRQYSLRDKDILPTHRNQFSFFQSNTEEYITGNTMQPQVEIMHKKMNKNISEQIELYELQNLKKSKKPPLYMKHRQKCPL